MTVWMRKRNSDEPSHAAVFDPKGWVTECGANLGNEVVQSELQRCKKCVELVVATDASVLAAIKKLNGARVIEINRYCSFEPAVIRRSCRRLQRMGSIEHRPGRDDAWFAKGSGR